MADADNRQRMEALTRLSVLRQAPITRETLKAYVDELQDIPGRVLTDVCREIGHTAREEHESAWPPLGILRSKALAIIRLEREREMSKRALAPPAGEPVSPERAKELLEQIKAAAHGKRMP